MKKFLKSRWHRIPVALVSSLLVLIMVTGGVFAWYEVTTGTAVVTVDEAIRYTVTGGDGIWDAGAEEWTVSIMAGEKKILYMTVYNDSSADLSVVAWATNVPAGLTVTGNLGVALNIPVTIPGGGSGPFSIEVHADGEVAPGTNTITFTLNRQSP